MQLSYLSPSLSIVPNKRAELKEFSEQIVNLRKIPPASCTGLLSLSLSGKFSHSSQVSETLQPPVKSGGSGRIAHPLFYAERPRIARFSQRVCMARGYVLQLNISHGSVGKSGAEARGGLAAGSRAGALALIRTLASGSEAVERTATCSVRNPFFRKSVSY